MRRRRGVILLDAIVALALIAIAAATILSLAASALAAVWRASATELEVRQASAFLGVVSLWPREDLERRLGARRQGHWVLRLERESPRVFRAAVEDTTGALVVATALFRPLPR